MKIGGTRVATINTATGAHQSVTLPDGTASVSTVWEAVRSISIGSIAKLRHEADLRVFCWPGEHDARPDQRVGNSYNAQRVVAALRPRPYIIDRWINDRTSSTYQNSLQSRIDTAKASGAMDIVPFGGHFMTNKATRQNYKDVMIALARQTMSFSFTFQHSQTG